MNDKLIRIFNNYSSKRNSEENIKDAIYRLYKVYIKEREETLMDAAAATAAVNALFLSDKIDFDKVTPQLEEAFKIAYPNIELSSLSERSPEELQGILKAWKGKYFEILVRDKLNAGEWLGDIHLEPGQVAKLAESAIQPKWDLQILNPDGTVADELQLKATRSLGYIKSALERYPDVKILTTDEAIDTAEELSDKILSSGISNEELEKTIRAPLESVLDSPSEEFFENILPHLPFVIIAVSEGLKVMLGRKTFELALVDSLNRALKTGLSIGVGAIFQILGGGVLSIPATFITRLLFDRYKILSKTFKRLNVKINDICELLPYYSNATILVENKNTKTVILKR